MILFSEENGEFLGEHEIADKILGLLIGGSHDTVSSTCASLVKYLAEFPDIYNGVYNEQIEIAKYKEPGELLDWKYLLKMKYTWRVICEVLRLVPPGQGFREITDFMYKRLLYPQGMEVSTHKNPEFFPEPENFDPSRFEGEGTTPYTFVPFGGGSQTFPGKEYARLETLVFMHHLVTKFKWEKIFPDEQIVFNPMPRPAKGLPICIYPQIS